MDLKELLGNIATGEIKDLSADDIKSVTDEYNNLVSLKGNQEENNKLKKELEDSNKKYEELEKKQQELKDRFLDKLFNNPDNSSGDKGKDDDNDDKDEITFDSLVKSDYQVK